MGFLMGFLITTSRRPTRRTRSFCKDLQRVLPSAFRVNRGKMNLIDIALKALELNVNRVILVSVFKGNPGRIHFFSVSNDSFAEIPPLINIRGVKLLREFRRWRLLRASSLIVAPMHGDENLLRFSSALANALNVEVRFPINFDVFPDDTAFLKVELSGDDQYNLCFVDKFNVPIGPLIRVKSVRFKTKSALEEVKFVES